MTAVEDLPEEETVAAAAIDLFVNPVADALPEYGWDEILRHNRTGDLWIVFHGGVYDVSEWIHRHPGGHEVYLESYGRDATALFEEIGHSAETWQLAQTFLVGRVRPGSTPPAEPPPPDVTEDALREHRMRVRGPGEVQSGPKLRPVSHAPDADPRALPEYDWEEVLRHDKPGDYWVVIARGIYDVSEWAFHHPGGAEVFISGYGHNLSRAFGEAGHSDEAAELMESFKVGRLKADSRPPSRPGSPSIVRTGGFMDPRRTVASDDTAAGDARPLEIPYAVRWLVPDGERFANFPVLNDNDTQLDYWRRFGHIYAVGIPTKKWRLVMVSDPELLEEVATNEEQFGKRVEDINFFDQLAGSRGGGISVVSDGPYYDMVRRLMLPWYAPAHQKTQFERMKGVARELTAVWETLDDSEPIDLRRWMERYALAISGLGACNYVFDVHPSNGHAEDLGAAVIESTKESVARITEPRPDSVLLARRRKRDRRRAYRRRNKQLFSTFESVVKGRIGTCPAGEQTDLLTRLLTVRDTKSGEPLDAQTIRDQVLMHLSNGFNGPSVTAAWLGHILATRPDVEERLIAEIDGVTGGDPEHDLEYTELMALPYMTQVIKETLRIYPPMPVTVRRSLRDGMLGRYRIRERDIILVGALAAQRDPRYWGDDADVFDPDQFAMEKVVQRPRHAFIPFSVGQRQCMAQEVTFMMLRVALFSIYNRYRLRPAPGARVVKNTAGTTKPVAVPVVRLPREPREARERALVERRLAAAAADLGAQRAAAGRAWDTPSEIPATSAFSHVVVAYGSNFGTSRGLAERFAERSHVYGFTSDVVPLDELVDKPARVQPWLLVVMTATYTGSPPSNAIAFKAWLERTEAGCETWQNCRYMVWGMGNSQWNAFLAFPRYVNEKLATLGAQPLAPIAYGDVGSPVWEEHHTQWNDRVWPALIELAGAQPSEAAAARLATQRAAEEALEQAESEAAMAMSLDGRIVAPTILTNAAGIATTTARVIVSRELQAPESPTRTRHLEVELPDGFRYTAGDHLGVCPRNSDELVERLAARLGAPLDGVFAVPKSMSVRAVPKGVPLQVRNVLTSLVDITSLPTLALIDALIERTVEPAERERLVTIRDALAAPDDAESMLRTAARAGAFNLVSLLDEAPSCRLNLFEFLQVAQPLRPRYYSTSSSPRIHGERAAHVSVGRNPVAIPGMPGREFCGMSSSYVHSLRDGDRVDVFLDRAEGFHLQDDVSLPMIFISAGTGYAPMRAFLWERLAMRREGITLGEAALFNGIRSSRLDYIYREEIEAFVNEGVVDHVNVAMSREVPGHREYVQDKLVAEGALVWRLVSRGGFVYVCGSQAMRDAVRGAFLRVLEQEAAMTTVEGERYLGRMETVENRYRPDIWG